MLGYSNYQNSTSSSGATMDQVDQMLQDDELRRQLQALMQAQQQPSDPYGRPDLQGQQPNRGKGGGGILGKLLGGGGGWSSGGMSGGGGYGF